jgi:hypothetical protein
VQEQIVSRFGDCRRDVMWSFDDDQQELCLGSSLVDFSFSRWVSHLFWRCTLRAHARDDIPEQ